MSNINRRLTQTYADSIFSLADLARENLHTLRVNRFLPNSQYSMESNVGISLHLST